MRTFRLTLTIICLISLKAQAQMPFYPSGFMQPAGFGYNNNVTDSNHAKKNWTVSMYSGITAGYGSFYGGNASFLLPQIGINLNRRLNNNLYAFAGVNVTPGYFNFNRPLNNADQYKNYMTSSAFGNNVYGVYPGIQAGLTYVNDAKTFSISGSIGVSKGSYPAYRPAMQKQLVTGSRQ